MQFDHEKLNVYQKAIEFVAISDRIIEKLPRGKAHLADQLYTNNFKNWEFDKETP